MRWEDYRRSDNIEDRRDDGYGGSSGPSFGGGGGGLGIGAIVVLGLIGWALGVDPRLLIGGAELVNGMRHGAQTTQQAPQRQAGSPSDQMGQFVAAVLAENEDIWSEILPAQKGVRYVNPTLVMYKGGTRSGCGGAQAAMGPFYCPNDQKIYLDTSFFQEMKQRLGGGGDFAYAYVISHEIGHHVQNLLGILPKVQAAQARASSKAQANALSVRVELMADCLAGVWAANANRKYQILEPGDVEKAVATAQAIGDDQLQKASRGYVVPDSFTHGSSAQRQQWLNAGLKSGEVDSCNTFAQ
ncbi:KPN_02809 family neutral zinc metallopeptidase [Methylocapsa acidiphila]|uniref:KPN_02809 family neutral zinc metallopeptidase n=1 Tax=Methylocapsa acidiphila TaxID=133552 RepID=UPI000417F043|nr:neutral zinc metallopeptidase [Methylocapsa acidiphila]